MNARGLAAALAAVGASLVLVVSSARAEGPQTVRGRCTFLGENVTVPSGNAIDCSQLWVVAGNVLLEPGASTRGDLRVLGGHARVGGVIEGSLTTLGGDLTVAEGGRVASDAFTTAHAEVQGVVDGGVAALGDVDLGPGAVVGRVAALGAVSRADSAVIRDVSASGEGGGIWASLGLILVFTLLSALFAAVLTLLAPVAVQRVRVAAATAPLLACLVGALVWGFAALVMVPLLFTIVGPLVLAALLLAGALMGWVALGSALGEGLRSGRSGAVTAGIGGAILGAGTALLIGGGSLLAGRAQGMVLCSGLLLLGLLWTWSLGASLLTLFGSRPWPRSARGPRSADRSTDGAGEPVASAPLDPGHSGGVAVAATPLLAPSADPDAGWSATASSAADGDPAQHALEAEGPSDARVGDMPRGAGPEPAEDLPAAIDARGGPAGAAAAADVRQVPGISPIYGLLLREAGFRTVGHLAAAEVAQVRSALAVPGVAAVEDTVLEGWIHAAQRLAAGG